MTYAQAQTAIESGKDVVLTVKSPSGVLESVVFTTEEYKNKPCEFALTVKPLLKGLRYQDGFMFSRL